MAMPLDPSANLPLPQAIDKILKSGTDYEKGEAYLRLSLASLKELASLLESERLSKSQKASYIGAYTNSKLLYDETTRIRDDLLKQKKSIGKLIINFFVRDKDAKRFHKVSHWSYSSIRRTSDGLNRLLLPEFENVGESAQGLNESITEESLHGVIEDRLSGVNSDVHTEQEAQETGVAISEEEDEEDDRTRSTCDATEAEDVSPNENIQDINLDLHSKQEVQEAFAIFGRLETVISTEEEEEEDDGRTIRPSSSQRRSPSPSPSRTINIFITQSVVSFGSESNGTTLNIGVDRGVGSSS